MPPVFSQLNSAHLIRNQQNLQRLAGFAGWVAGDVRSENIRDISFSAREKPGI
jgi:hypothetical protein